MSTSPNKLYCPDPVRRCWGPRCRPRQILSPRQRRYHSRRCRLDAKNSRRYSSAEARAANVAAVRRHRDRLKVIDPLRRYFCDAAGEIIRVYAQAGRTLRRGEVMNVFRAVERKVGSPNLIRKKVRDLVQIAHRDALRYQLKSKLPAREFLRERSGRG
jgi:hypothetical protein